MGRDDQLKDFQRFDFDGRADFQAWLSSVEVAGAIDSAMLTRLRAKWYKKNIDVNFQLEWATQAGAGSTRQPSSTPTPAGNASYGTQSTPTPPPTWQQPSQGGTRGSTSTQFYLAVYHLTVVALSVLHLVFLVVPMLPGMSRLPLLPGLSTRAYRLLMMVLVVGQACKLIITYGKPPILPFSWPGGSGCTPYPTSITACSSYFKGVSQVVLAAHLSISGLKQYLSQIVPTSDFFCFLIGSSFSVPPPMSLVAVAVSVPALYSFMAWASGRLNNTSLWQAYGAKLHQLLLQKQRDSQLMCAYCEVWVGASLILALLGRHRNFMLAFGYWNLLKMRYHIGDTAAQHRLVWYAIGQKTAGIRQRVPILNTVISKASSWFLSVQ